MKLRTQIVLNIEIEHRSNAGPFAPNSVRMQHPLVAAEKKVTGNIL